MKMQVGARTRSRVAEGVRRPGNWLQLGRFCIVGGSGYAVNLTSFALAVHGGVDHRIAATLAFLIAVANNFWWNRRWTFDVGHGQLAGEARRFFTASLGAFLLALGVLEVLVAARVPALLAQAASVALATPLSFVAHKLWTFVHERPAAAD